MNDTFGQTTQLTAFETLNLEKPDKHMKTKNPVEILSCMKKKST